MFAFQDNNIDTVESVFKIPLTEECKERLNTSISFPSKEFVCIGDGCGKLYIIHSEGRTKSGSTEWKTSFVYEFEQPFEITHTIQDAETGTLSCLMLSMIEKDDEISAKKAHVVKLALGVFSQVVSSGASSFTCEAIKHIQGHCAPLYAVIEPGNKAVIVACEKPFHLLKGIEIFFSGKRNSSIKHPSSNTCTPRTSEIRRFMVS